MRWSQGFALAAGALLAACASRPPVVETRTSPQIPSAGFGQVPPFSRLGYEPFTRADAVAVALREWRLWGSLVDDDPPGNRTPDAPGDRPDRYPGMWQRVGEYWWIGEDASSVTAYWTGKHDGNGRAFGPNQYANEPWSAAFISYIFRIAGAGDRFPYAPAHAVYINAAKSQADMGGGPLVVTAARPSDYAPRAGDVVCMGRGTSQALSYDRLPTSSFPGHCDFVVAAGGGQLSVIGGNVDAAVTMKHIPTAPDGRLVDANGTVVDTRYPWFVILRVTYDR